MNAIHYIGFDVHKKTISFCVKTADGQIVEEGHTGSGTYGVAALGGSSETSLAWRDGSDAVQCLDLRHPEALCPATFHGPSGQDEGHYRRQEQKRSYRCTYHRRSAALQPAACLLCVTAGVARSATSAPLSQPGGTTIGAHAEQDGRPADGERNPIRQAEAARKKYFTDLMKSLEEVPDRSKICCA
jgi:hypothetical protein